MAGVKPLYSTCVAVLGFVCLVIGAAAIGIPYWGYFDTVNGGRGEENGYFGLWKICRIMSFNREWCGNNVSKFRPKGEVLLAGVLACIGEGAIAIFCVLSVLQLAMISSKEQVVLKYSAAVLTKVGLSLTAALLAIATAGLFSLQTDERATNGIQITRGPSFYIQILLIFLEGTLFVMSLYDMLFSRRDGDPTNVSMPVEATTYGNPGFRERGVNGGGISMTDASGKPYMQPHYAGSVMSMNTTSTTLGSTNGSTVTSSITRSPLRSSLKKPRPKEGLGIQNPGFSGSSPTFPRNGSMKKVRIQTHSTDV